MVKKRRQKDEDGQAPDQEQDLAESLASAVGEAVAGEGAEPAGGAAGEDDPTLLLKGGVDGLRDRCLRLQADFENYRRRVLREREETARRAQQGLMEDLLPVLDHLDLAMQAAADHAADNGVVEGFRMVAEQLRGVLGRYGLEAVEADGAVFDPVWHEAISHIPSADVAENAVIQQTRRGYKLGEFLLRPAQVVVSSGPAAAAAGSEPQADKG